MSRLNQIDHAIARLREELRPHEQRAEKRTKPRVVKQPENAA
jgi:hypothetical protein